MSAIVIAHAWGAELCTVGGRNAWAQSPPAWVLVAPNGLPLLPGRSTSASDALCEAILSDPPADAWRGTAEELGAAIAPVAGRHCAVCRGSGQSSDDEDTWACECVPPRSPVARIRGTSFGPQQLAVLREVLHTLPPQTAVRAWLSAPLDFGSRRKGSAWGSHPILVVDFDGWRFGLAPRLADDAARVEVTL